MYNIANDFIVLVIKGGGSAYVSPAVILKTLSEKIGMEPSEFADLIVGASSGGILGGSLVMPSDEDPTKPKYTCDDLINFDFDEAPNIFKRPFNKKWMNYLKITFGNLYPSDNLSSVFEKKYGDLTVQDSITPFAMPVLNYETGKTNLILGGFDQKTIYNIHQKTGMIFPNFKMSDGMTAACSAAPYFPIYNTPSVPGKYDQTLHIQGPKSYNFYDGGLRDNNPVKWSHLLAKQIMQSKGIENKKIRIINIGLDSDDNTLSVSEIKKGGFTRLFNPRKDIPFTYILRDRDGYDDINILRAENNLDITELTPRYTQQHEKNYGQKYSLDKAEPTYLQNLITITEKYIEDNNSKVETLAHAVKREHFLRDQIKKENVIPFVIAKNSPTKPKNLQYGA